MRRRKALRDRSALHLCGVVPAQLRDLRPVSRAETAWMMRVPGDGRAELDDVTAGPLRLARSWTM